MEKSYQGNKPFTEQEMNEMYNIDLDRFEVEKMEGTHWQQGQKGPDGKPVLIDLYRTAMKWKLKHPILNYEEVLRTIFGSKIPERAIKTQKDGELLLLLLNADLHMDRAENSNPQKYLNEINDRTLNIVDKADRYSGFDRILYANLGDYYNSDINRRTTKGTEQVNSIPETEAFKIGTKSQIELLHWLSQFSDQVKGIYVPGNHDMNKTQFMSDALDLYYADNPKIDIDNSIAPRKYEDWGNTLLGFMHGHDLANKELLSTMSLEHKLKKFNYMFRGHFHNTLEQLHGILQLQGVGSPATPSKWERMKGYVNKSPLIGIVFDKKKGKVLQLEG